MAVAAERVAVGTSAVALNTVNVAGQTLVLGTDADVVLGGSDVTTATGLALAAADPPLTIHLDAGDVLYGIATATANVQVLRT